MDVEEWTEELVRSACLAIIGYENHLRNDGDISDAKHLARAMRRLKDAVPTEILETVRG